MLVSYNEIWAEVLLLFGCLWVLIQNICEYPPFLATSSLYSLKMRLSMAKTEPFIVDSVWKLLLFIIALEYAIRNLQERDRLELN
jgi:hypothetical protein